MVMVVVVTPVIALLDIVGSRIDRCVIRLILDDRRRSDVHWLGPNVDWLLVIINGLRLRVDHGRRIRITNADGPIDLIAGHRAWYHGGNAGQGNQADDQ